MEHGNGKEASTMKKGWVAFSASVEEGLQDAKASIAGLAKKATARSEEEASQADLETAKKQVEAADAAEEKKKQAQT
ncbi:hypothetical protein ZIOFF_068562 [Zingiber officinale]|uniref:Uncharacterized protein n=1 Tax=Zingiber officinale TaxID=94328 RepID=A0A8J5CHA8_ZINOF|nr:hypothetical protein ZIOFF_068562 [Zingiber officinale]